jgi:hypothetical protein
MHPPIENNDQTALALKDEELPSHGRAGSKLGNVTCRNARLYVYGKF